MIRIPRSPAVVHEDREHGQPLDDCWFCQRDRARCRSKRAWTDPVEASLAATQQNVETGWARPVQPYRCGWCWNWHQATAKRTHQRKRAARAQRRHTNRQEQQQ